MRTLERTRPELANFLRAQRERLSPQDVGLPVSTRRRMPGLRREEVAALAGVGLSWYTWLEQGRDIGVSSGFLDNLARVLKLDAHERRHLFLLAQGRPPAEPGKTWCAVPPLVSRLMKDLPHHATYVLNLRWDVLGYNDAADALFNFSSQPASRRNLLWLLFCDPRFREILDDWPTQAATMLASFRRDFAQAREDVDMRDLIAELEKTSPEFRSWWRHADVRPPCTGARTIHVDGQLIAFEHTSLTIDGGRHLRLVIYAAPAASTQAEDVAQSDARSDRTGPPC